MSFSVTVPREPLARFRLLALWFALFISAANCVALPLVGHLARPQLLEAELASVALGVWWAYGWHRGSFPAFGWVIEPPLLILMAITSPIPLRALGAFYAATQLRSLYVTRRELLLLVAEISIARVISVFIAPVGGEYGAFSSTTIVQVIGLSVIAVSLHSFVSALQRQEEVERALTRSDERYRMLARATRDVFYELDTSNGSIEWSESMLSVFGYYPAEVGRDVTWWIDRIHPDDRDAMVASRRAFLADPSRSSDSSRYRILRADGTYANVSGYALAQRAPDGSAPRLIGAIRDVTVESQLAEQLRESQKMEAVGQLAGGVAHDFNNLLTVIGGHVYMIEAKVPRTEIGDHHLRGITKTADRAAQLTKQLLAFSRRQLMKPAVLNPNSIVDEVLSMIRPAIGERIVVETRLDPLLAPVLVDSGQLVQVLVNLALNARDAMPNGGTLSIETENATLTSGSEAANATSLPPGDYVRITMADSGIGMTATTLARAFEPFFTTKPPGSGTGLGLATAYGIVKQSMGDIRADSRPGEGSTFTVLLPAAKRPVDLTSNDASSAPAPSAENEQHVLLVEDDDGVREFAREVLVGAGYTVHEATNGADGLNVGRPILPTIDVVVTDIVMPKMGGREMVDHLRRERPDLRVLYMTGYTDDSETLGQLRATDASLLEKPFGARALARAVANVPVR